MWYAIAIGVVFIFVAAVLFVIRNNKQESNPT